MIPGAFAELFIRVGRLDTQYRQIAAQYAGDLFLAVRYMSSVVRLSSVCNVRAPYSGD